jgi:tripartite-type tricarboxylate transporter receptor subunit TctC
VFRLLGSISDIGRSIVAGPGTPMDRAQVLRSAVSEMVKDPAFIADAAQLGLDINYLSGPDLQKMVDQLMGSPGAVIEKAKAVTAPQK